MGKIFSVLIISVCAASTCFALGLELSDVIKEARNVEKSKLSQNQIKETSIQPVKNNHQKEVNGEQSASEKINTNKTQSNYNK